MDIPNTGAVFTLGKSHLAENTQSYFYIKNDPIKKLIAGPHQSAVICDSGRLFVWGENQFGQLGIGGNSLQNANITSNNNADIVIKPTCVKSLKILGLKIADIAFGNEWSVVLTHSNELFFSGRCIFARESAVSSNFTAATVSGEECRIIRKPFRIEEFDDCLSNNEEAESFVNVLAGNEHFVVLTSFGRLVSWGSNQAHQLGSSDVSLSTPHEIVLNSPVQQFTCGPESTLVLTQKGNLYLTGRLNEFVFPQFTELQKNLPQNEQIIFMHISHASEIFIVTNTGSIYRSLESKRNKNLIFQRFYDYDSEENGPIWKILKGTSFYAVLTKANKFYTTFSESGHHLKTFREISKFKNLRLLDMALGDQHVLVHGIPRSSTLAATFGPVGGSQLMSPTALLASSEGNLIDRKKPLEKRSNALDTVQTSSPPTDKNESVGSANDHGKETPKSTDTNNNSNRTTGEATQTLSPKADIRNDIDNEVRRNSPTESLKSRYSLNSINKLKQVGSSENKLRPRTPYPESSAGSSPNTVVKKTPLRNTSYDMAMKEVYMTNTSPALMDSLENITEAVAGETVLMPDVKVCMPSPPIEEDEQLTVEISETTDPLDHTVTVNEIRFINNGIDVTANVKKLKSLGSEDSLDTFGDETKADNKLTIRKQAEDFLDELEEEIDEKLENVKKSKTEAMEAASEKTSNLEDKIEKKFDEAKESIDNAKKEAGEIAGSTISAAKDSIESTTSKVSLGAKGAMGAVGESARKAKESIDNAKKETGEAAGSTISAAKDSIESTASKVALGAKGAMDAVGENAREAKESIDNAKKETGEIAGSTITAAKDSIESTASKVALGAKGAMDAVGENARKAVKEAKATMDNVSSSAAKATGNALHSIEEMGNSAVKASGDAKDAVGNTIRKMAEDTRHAVGAVTSKISHEMQDAKNSLSVLMHGKKNKVDVEAPAKLSEVTEDTHEVVIVKENTGENRPTASSVSNTNTPGGQQEDDERTTASVNSNHTSAGNPFDNNESSNPFENNGSRNPFESNDNNNPFDEELNQMIERSKLAYQEDVERASQATDHHIGQATEAVLEEKSKFSKFLDDMRQKSKALSCHNEKAVKIIDDQPPRYTEEDELALQPVNGRHPNGSKVCNIL